MKNRAVLIILDGFGIGKHSPFNAVENGKMPFFRDIMNKHPHSQLITHGPSVGLPVGVMGNSEVGHMTMGAGRIIYQDLTRISKSIENQDFFKNAVLHQTIEAGAKKTGRVHLMGLLSDGGVHSHIDHLLALLDLCVQLKVPKVSVHAFLDGRDTPPHSASIYLKKLLNHPAFSKTDGASTQATLVTLMGRFWAMDRDKRWDRISRAYLTLTGQSPETRVDPFQALQNSYQNNKSDEFVEPILFSQSGAMQSGDSVIFFNYRSDRAREMTEAITEPGFSHFDRGRGFQPSAFAGMAVYDKNLIHAEAAFLPQNFNHLFGEWLEEHHLTQFRIAETEKYAHVTFFFNGGREVPYQGEDRILIPSPKDVVTYDLKPEMSAVAVAREAAKRLREEKYDFVLMNFANADMIGHTGNYDAALQAVESLDTCLAQVIGAAENSGYHVLLTADHGNIEEMKDDQGRIHTQHTLNPVPVLWIAPPGALLKKGLKDGTLADIMPTLCELMKLPIPPEVTGHSLLTGTIA